MRDTTAALEWQARQNFCVAVDIDRETPAFLPFES